MALLRKQFHRFGSSKLSSPGSFADESIGYRGEAVQRLGMRLIRRGTVLREGGKELRRACTASVVRISLIGYILI